MRDLVDIWRCLSQKYLKVVPWDVPSTQCCGELGCPTVEHVPSQLRLTCLLLTLGVSCFWVCVIYVDKSALWVFNVGRCIACQCSMYTASAGTCMYACMCACLAMLPHLPRRTDCLWGPRGRWRPGCLGPGCLGILVLLSRLSPSLPSL